MPLFDEVRTQDMLLAVWHITESDEELRFLLPESCGADFLEETISDRSAKRRREKLVTRLLIYRFASPACRLCHYPSGRPYLEGSDSFVSISHTGDYVAVALSAKAVGIDIEADARNILARVGPRVFSVEEMNAVHRLLMPEERQTARLLLWSAKESLYKLFDFQGADFRTQLLLSAFPLSLSPQGRFSALVVHPEEGEVRLQIRYKVYPDFVLTFARRP